MLSEEIISRLEGRGFSRWTKGNMDRLYINAAQLGLECTYYHTGNISSAQFNGRSISNSEARRFKAAKTYINVKTGDIISDYLDLKEAAQAILDEVAAGEGEEE